MGEKCDPLSGGVTDRPVLPLPYRGLPIGDVRREGGWLTPKSGVRLEGMEGANRLFSMGVKRV